MVAEKLTSASIDFIKENKKEPFFLYLAHWEVHGPKSAKKDRISYFQNKKENLGFSEFNAVYAAEVEQLDVSVKEFMKHSKLKTF